MPQDGTRATAQRKTGAEQTARLRAVFGPLLSTLARRIVARESEWGLLATHPLAGVKASQSDRSAKVRYLSHRTKKSAYAPPWLLEMTNDGQGASGRMRGGGDVVTRNGRPTGRYSDHLTPIVLLALNTGMRRGELFALRWEDVTREWRRSAG